MEECQLHMTTVKEEPREHHHHHHRDDGAKRSRSDDVYHHSRTAESILADMERRSQHSGGHRRHYQDFGTINLGTIGSSTPQPKGPEDEGSDTPSQGQIQREFYDHYGTVLNRKYQTRNKSTLLRSLVIALLLALVVVAVLIGVSTIQPKGEPDLVAATKETIQVVDLDDLD